MCRALFSVGLGTLAFAAAVLLPLRIAKAQGGPEKRLPARAKIHFETTWKGEIPPGAEKACERTYRLNAAEVRRRFATWHEVSSQAFDEGAYVYIECGRSGTATLDGKTYVWSVEPEDNMTTSWPDGKTHWYVRRVTKKLRK